MDVEQARALLSAERTRVEGLLRLTKSAGEDDRNEANAGGGEGRLNLFSLITDDCVNIGDGHNLAGGSDYVSEERLAADLVKHLGTARFEASTFAGCHDDYGQL